MSTSQRHLGRGLFRAHAIGEKSKGRNVLIRAFSWILPKIRRISTSWIAWLGALDVVRRDYSRPHFHTETDGLCMRNINKSQLAGLANYPDHHIKANEAFWERISEGMENGYPLQGLCHYRIKWLDVPTNRRFYFSIQYSIGHSVPFRCECTCRIRGTSVAINRAPLTHQWA